MAISSTLTHPHNHRAALKKARVSDTHDPALQPSKQNGNHPPPSMNDDAAEKAKRRKSAHFKELAVEGRERNVGKDRSASGQQQGMTQHQRRAKRLSAVEPSLPVVSMEVMNTNFEEWMKLATDNKITANNTWNFALIDYFADLTLLRNGPDDQSINFQKASYTLDGCIKIWTSRVDSVATETGKLLSGLAGGPEDDTEEGGDGDGEEGGEPKATRKTARSEATLAKSFSQLQVKKFDLEFTVDPLFKKTCADFDEGGAMGLLMNHLSVDGKGRVVFDAGDAGAEEDDEEEMEPEEEEMVELGKLREFIPSVDAVQSLSISDTLSSFRFSSDPTDSPDFSTLLGLKHSFHDDDGGGTNFQDDVYDDYSMDPSGSGEAHDFFGDEDFDAAPIGGGRGFNDDMSMAGDDVEARQGYGSGAGVGGGSLAMVGPGERLGPFDPRRQGGGELVMAFGAGKDGDDEGMFDYFDKGMGKAWAGAEHWKLRKVSRKDAAAPSDTKATKAAKAAFTIDFTSPSTAATSSKVLFAPATRASIALPATRSTSKSGRKAAKMREEWLLPDDMHFSSQQLLRLFLKPKFSLRVRRTAQSVQLTNNGNGEIDENFWAQAAAERDEDNMPMMDMDYESNPAPFESQFFHDDADDAFVDDALDTVDAALDPGEVDDLWAATQGTELRKSRPENVNFAKKAKRVDVKRLKDDIWTGLKSLVPAEVEKGMSSGEDEGQPATPTIVEPVKTFDNIIQSLRQSYPAEKMSEISTSFCFICLLHLANEEGLVIETARNDGKDGEDVGCQGMVALQDMVDDGLVRNKMDQGERKDRVVGELEALKVYKDHNAGRAA